MSIRHATQPAEEGGVIREDTHSPFVPKRKEFESRLSEQLRAARENAVAARAHLTALENRIAQAAIALQMGNLGSARAYLQIGRHDFDAALATVPDL